MKITGTIKTIIIIGVLLCQALVWSAWPYENTFDGYLAGKTDLLKNPKEACNEAAKGDEEAPSADGAATQPEDAQNSQVDGEEPVPADIDSGYLILVNKQHYLDKDYKPEDLVDIKYYAKDRSSEGRFMRSEAADGFHKLSEAAAEEGYEIVVTTAYRSYGFQSTLYNGYVSREGQKAADTYSAKPGTSEHQTGLAADVSSPSVGYKLTTEYADTPEGKWLAEKAHEYGFIIRFPKGAEQTTGYMHEPWHIRYVGEKAAREIYKEGITLEEYLDNGKEN